MQEKLPPEHSFSNEDLARAGANAQVWAQGFMKTLQDKPNTVIDEEFMEGWFAAAIMAGWDEADRRRAKNVTGWAKIWRIFSRHC